VRALLCKQGHLFPTLLSHLLVGGLRLTLVGVFTPQKSANTINQDSREPELSVVVHYCNPSTQEAEAGCLQAPGPPGLHG
jgi:hypothetical protein